MVFESRVEGVWDDLGFSIEVKVFRMEIGIVGNGIEGENEIEQSKA